VFLNFIAQLPLNQGIKIISLHFFRSFISLQATILNRIFVFFCLMAPILSPAQNFWSTQLKYPRVASAWKSVKPQVESKLKAAGVSKDNFYLFLRAFKQEKQLEVWVSSSAKGPFTLLETYDVCAASGNLGPKIKQGDQQVPEGVYYIDRFNPQSSFHLSLGINYPNSIDLKRSGNQNAGGDIFIHGACASIGCLAITDTYINELYVLAALAKSGNQPNIPVHIFPFRMNDQAMQLVNRLRINSQWKLFWENLATVYNHFEASKSLGIWKGDANGKYFLSK
jgi:murein L,D-transpeptidase YafK